MKKSLIVYFSHRKENYVAGAIKDLKIGNTEVIAKKVQAIIEQNYLKFILFMNIRLNMMSVQN